MSWMREQAWSPYVAGTLIGLLQIPAFLLVGTPLSASSSYATGAKNWWQVALVAGIALGAYASARLSGSRRRRISPVWRRALGTSSPALRFAFAFVGGFLVLLGARIAEGCTSGHGISGMAQLALSSVIVVGATLAGGVATALVLLNRVR